MYDISKSKREVNGVMVETQQIEIPGFNIIEVEVGTTGDCGGDTGHGGRTYLRIEDLSSTDIETNILLDKSGYEVGFEVKLGGDSELCTLIQALEFALEVLKEQSEKR